MKKKIMLKGIVIILIVVEVISLYLLYNTGNKNVLDEVVATSLKNKKQSIAIMVQQDDNTWRAAENRNAWPSSATHGFVGSKCYDGNGALVESLDVLKFDLNTYTAIINTTNSVYCTLYFAKGKNALELLQEKGKTTFASGNLIAVDGLYRFKGTYSQVLNNYICFGTTVESTCTGTPATYMYRIIGISSEADNTIGLYSSQLKIIKAVPSLTNQEWGGFMYNYPVWEESKLKEYLNTTFLNTIKNGTDGTYWNGIISQHGWYVTVQESLPGTVEPKDTTLAGDSNNIIGLMYATDFNNAGNWLLLSNGWTNNSPDGEWTMSKFDDDVGSGAWYIDQSGYVTNAYIERELSVRPVFYLNTGTNLTGEGTKDHPFIISGVMPQD